MLKKSVLRVGNASGFWGDDPDALERQVKKGPIDYITLDFLAEVTMSVLRKQYLKDSSLGYAKHFVPMLLNVLPDLLERKIRIITNAGGINPKACAELIYSEAKKRGYKPRIALVWGDDIVSHIDELIDLGSEFKNFETGEDLQTIKSRLSSANVYFGAAPIVRALEKWQPDIIITGRVTDAAISLAPMIYEFGWSLNDWDKLASGTIAAHILECGSQATGGNFTDWRKVKSYDDIGFPIVEMSPDASFVVTKHPGTGGLVSVDTIKEQLLYEIVNPKAYMTPDVICDFTSIKIEELSENRVKLSEIKGFAPSSSYKVSMAYQDGFKCVGSILISGPDAREKAQLFSQIFWKKLEYLHFTETSTELVGFNSCHRSLVAYADSNEISLRFAAKAQTQEPLHVFSKTIASLILSGPAGVCVLGGAPKVQEIISYWPALLGKDKVFPRMGCLDDFSEIVIKDTATGYFSIDDKLNCQEARVPTQTISETLAENTSGVSLAELCLTRSGDKGNMVNIGVIARNEKSYLLLDKYLTAQYIKNFFQELCEGSVKRYSAPNLLGFNFVLEKSLGGGGSSTLRTDAQGKTFGQALLMQRIKLI